MAYEPKELEGVLFFNSKKQGKQPDRRGSIFINGIEYELAGWNHELPSGVFLTRLKATPKPKV